MRDFTASGLGSLGSKDVFAKLRETRAEEKTDQRDREKERRQIEKHWAALSRERKLALMAIAVVSVMSIGLSKYGLDFSLMRDGGVTLQTRLASIGVAISAGVGQIIGWLILLETKYYQGFWRKLGGFVGALAFLLYGYSTSSYFNLSALASPSATMIYRGEQVDERIAVFDAARSQAESVSLLKPLLDGETQSWCAAAAAEQASGAFSGSAGKGRMSGILTGMCARAKAALAAVIAAEAVVGSARAKAEGVMAELEVLLSDVETPVLERERQIAKKLREVDGVIREMDRVQIAEVAKAYFQTQAASLVSLGAGDPTSLEGRRNIALLELKQAAEQRSPIIEDVVRKIKAAASPELTLKSRPTMNDLIYHSVDRHIPQVALALGLDSLGCFFILVLLCKEPRRREEV